MLRIGLSFLMCVFTLFSSAQTGRFYQDVFTTFFTNTALVNPSYVPEIGKVNLTATHKFRQGLLGDISTFSASGEKVWRSQESYTHVGRLIFVNEKEGKYISSPKAYANYALRINLSEETSLMSGIALGVSGINYSAPSGASSIMLPDGGIGIGLKHKKIHVGFSSLQVLNTSGTVITSKVRLQRYFNLNFTGEKAISPSISLKSHFLWRGLPYLSDQYIAAFSFVYKDMFEAGSLYFYPRGLSYFTLITLDTESNALQINLTYNSAALSINPVMGDSYEVGLRYCLK